MTTLKQLNTCDPQSFTDILHGLYEHSPWIPERAAQQRPFRSLGAFKLALQQVVTAATREEQLGLIRAHPELAGKAAVAGELTPESTGEQAKASLHLCSPEEFSALNELNTSYNAKFRFPFIIAVKGADGKGLTRQADVTHYRRGGPHPARFPAPLQAKTGPQCKIGKLARGIIHCSGPGIYGIINKGYAHIHKQLRCSSTTLHITRRISAADWKHRKVGPMLTK